MRIVAPGTMAEIDRRSQEEFHIPGILLMENAGLKAFQRFQQIWDSAEPTPFLRDLNCVCVAGGGNNGGDALVIARQAHIAGMNHVHVVMRNRRMNELAEIHNTIVASLGIPVVYWEEGEEARRLLRDADLVFDGIAGTGMKGALQGSAAGMVECINTETAAYVIAVDIPSGLSSSWEPGFPVVEADLTLTMGLPKDPLYTPMGRPFCGEIEVIDPGFPPQLLDEADGAGVVVLRGSGDPLWRELAVDSCDQWAYKSTRGHLAIFAGSEGTTGAAVLSAESAARTGTGLVTLYSDPPVYQITASQLSSVMVRQLREDDDEADLKDRLCERHSALLAGPGWGTRKRDRVLLNLLESGLPGVIDADGIRVLKSLCDQKGTREIGSMMGGRWILTPHPGEFLVLTEGSSVECGKDALLAHPLTAIRELAAALQAVIVLKSHVVWIAAPDGRYFVIDGMNPAMGTGGSGDVLAGIAGGLVSRGLSVVDAAVTAAAVHQRAGLLAAREEGWFLAEDLPSYVSSILGGGEREHF